MTPTCQRIRRAKVIYRQTLNGTPQEEGVQSSARIGLLGYRELMVVHPDVPGPRPLGLIGCNAEGDGPVAFPALPRSDGDPGAVLVGPPLDVTPVDDIHRKAPRSTFLGKFQRLGNHLQLAGRSFLSHFHLIPRMATLPRRTYLLSLGASETATMPWLSAKEATVAVDPVAAVIGLSRKIVVGQSAYRTRSLRLGRRHLNLTRTPGGSKARQAFRTDGIGAFGNPQGDLISTLQPCAVGGGQSNGMLARRQTVHQQRRSVPQNSRKIRRPFELVVRSHPSFKS